MADPFSALERGGHEINTALTALQGMQELHRTGPVAAAVDARLTPNLAEIEQAVADHRSI